MTFPSKCATRKTVSLSGPSESMVIIANLKANQNHLNLSQSPQLQLQVGSRQAITAGTSRIWATKKDMNTSPENRFFAKCIWTAMPWQSSTMDYQMLLFLNGTAFEEHFHCRIFRKSISIPTRPQTSILSGLTHLVGSNRCLVGSENFDRHFIKISSDSQPTVTESSTKHTLAKW